MATPFRFACARAALVALLCAGAPLALALDPPAEQQPQPASDRDLSPPGIDAPAPARSDAMQDEIADRSAEGRDRDGNPPANDPLRQPKPRDDRSQSTNEIAKEYAPNAVNDNVKAKFDAIDTNHDGTIDRSEAAASGVLANQFDALDKQGNGRLTIEEFAAATDIALIRNEHHDYH